MRWKALVMVVGLLVGAGGVQAQIPYPSYRYHCTLPAKLVNNAAEDAALPVGYQATPFTPAQLAACVAVGTPNVAVYGGTAVGSDLILQGTSNSAPSGANVTINPNQGGQVFFPDGTGALPGIAFGTTPALGLYKADNTTLGLENTNTFQINSVNNSGVALTAGQVGLGRNTVLGWASTGVPAPADTVISRGGVDTIQLGKQDQIVVTPQTLRVQNATGDANINAAGSFTVKGPLGTGTGAVGVIDFQGGALGTASGATAHTAVSRLVLGASKVLTDAVAGNLVSAAIANGSAIGGAIEYTIEVSDGTDFQAETSRVLYSAVNKAGVVTVTITEDADTTQAVSAGSLTSVWALSAANPAVLSVVADSSLTPAAGFPRITYTITNLGQQAIAIQ